MGAYRHPMAWEIDLAGAKRCGARIFQTCTARDCGQKVDLDVDMLIADRGPTYSLWDRRPACSRCGVPGHYMISAGAVFTPMLSGKPTAEAKKAQHRELLDRLGLSKEDWARIKALAEEGLTQPHGPPPVLDDLAQPLKVAAVPPDQAWLYGGTPLGRWRGQQLLMWRMSMGERAEWERRRQGR